VTAADATATGPVARGLGETRVRVERLVPLVGAYLLLATFYAWQAWRRETPTIFTDELETTQISRAIADTGHAMRRGEPYGFTSLVPYLTAPFWWIHPVASAYETIKTVQAFVMAAAIFPAYLLARRVVTPGWALFAAVGTIAAPALSYSPILVEEPWAYPAATLALWLTVRATDRPSKASFALASAACVVAVLVRSQLVAVFGALAAGLLVLGWRSARMRRYRAGWSTWDAAGFWILAAGALIAVVAFAGHRSTEWETATTLWKGRMVEYGSWAGGAFAIGVGIVPAVALLAVLGVPARERERPGVRAFVAVTGGAVASFAWYAAIKGTYLSTNFSSLVVERNLIYLTPLAFVATAYLLERAAAPVWAVVVSGAVVLGLIGWTPIDRGLDNFPYYEAHGFAILALANREWHWPRDRIALALVVIVILAVALLLLTATPLRPARLALWLPAALAVAVLGWNAVAETYASIGEHDFSSRVATNLPQPKDWIDRAARGGSTVVLGQRMNDDPLGFASAEFWNRSIQKVWSVDGTGPGPGHTLTPDLQDVDGTLWPNPETDFVLGANGVEVAGENVATNPAANASLVRLDGQPIRLSSNETGVARDGWMIGDAGNPDVPARAAHNQFDVTHGGSGTLQVFLSRQVFCPKGARLPGVARVRIGPIVRGRDKQPAIGRVTGAATTYVPACGSRAVVLTTPKVPWRAEVSIETFVPKQEDPSSSDARALGAQVGFSILPR
jgi:hypothetical protein